MIKAEHKKWAEIVFDFYINRLLKKHFNNFYLINELPSIPRDAGLIITPNHFSWWDGFFIDYLFKKISKRKLHLMMLEDQLKRYWFFKKVGAFSIDLNKPKKVYESLQYSKEILSNTKNYLVIYPQGRLEAYDVKPLDVKSGLNALIKDVNYETIILPVAFKIKYGKEKYPDILVRFGQPFRSEKIKNDFSIFKNEFNLNKEELDKTADNSAYKNIFKI